MKHVSSAQRVAIYGIFVALSLVLGYLEHLVPLPIGIYGVKLGLSNLATVSVLYLLGGIPAITLNFLRIILTSLLFGNAFSFAYSLCGGILSALVMTAFKKTNKLGVMGISICGGLTHNISQLAVAIMLVDNIKITFYLPVLLLAGAIMGALIGIISLPVVSNKHINKLCQKNYKHKEK